MCYYGFTLNMILPLCRYAFSCRDNRPLSNVDPVTVNFPHSYVTFSNWAIEMYPDRIKNSCVLAPNNQHKIALTRTRYELRNCLRVKPITTEKIITFEVLQRILK